MKHLIDNLPIKNMCKKKKIELRLKLRLDITLSF